jgi:hypothetical protein
MKPQFTPGPWRTTGLNVRADDALVCYATNHWANYETPESERQANANLIASAPDLLAALERLTHPMADDEDLAYAREVIRKARGLAVKSHE